MIIDKRKIGSNHPVFFIADIAANHDGSLERAKKLIRLAANSGADAAKFQHFKAETIVSDIGFKKLKKQKSHQSKWKKSVFEVYKDASVDLRWTEILKKECKKRGIVFFTSPYDLDYVDFIDKYVSAYKIGSGDITYLDIIKKISLKKKPIILASGASTLKDVDRAVKFILKLNKNLCLMQCNTNYTAEIKNFNYINLNVLKLYKKKYPNLILGLSDHTPGHSTVLGAITLGAKVVEKHFTDDNSRIGPDHAFSMNPKTWKEMIVRSRELEMSLGNGFKSIEKNEKDTVIVQRRSIRAARDLSKGEILKDSDIISLRPCPKNSISPFEKKKILNKKLKKKIKKGDTIQWTHLQL